MNRKSHRLSILVMSALDRIPAGASAPILAVVTILFRVPNNTVPGRRRRAGGQKRIENAGGPRVRGSEGSHWGRRSRLPGVQLRSFRSSQVDLGVVFENPSSVGNELDGIDGRPGDRLVGAALQWRLQADRWRPVAVTDRQAYPHDNIPAATDNEPSFVRRGTVGSFPLCFRAHRQAKSTGRRAWTAPSKPAEKEQ